MVQSRPFACLLDPVVILVVNGSREETGEFRRLLNGSDWALQAVASVAAAGEWLARNSTPVVLCESRLPDGDWKDILRLATEMNTHPNVVVTSRLADDRLWAEVLNLGGYDVLALPASAAEIYQTLSSACRNWNGPGSGCAFGSHALLCAR
jgi:DNA-binding NtrC family response regulator